MTMTVAISQALVCTRKNAFVRTNPLYSKPPPLFGHQFYKGGGRKVKEESLDLKRSWSRSRSLSVSLFCKAGRNAADSAKKGVVDDEEEESVSVRMKVAVVKIVLWGAEAVYILWLFLLPYAPGDPVWAISSDTVNSLVGLSLNFFLILPFINAVFCILNHLCNGRVVGIHLIQAPVLHPMSEGLFNFVIGWTFMFAPLLLTDRNRDRYKGSLDVLWCFQMFLTNTFLIPYMAIRLNEADAEGSLRKPSQLASLMTNGAPIVGLVGGAVCLISALWAFFGRTDGNFGNVADRLNFLVSYLGSERLAYAFIWDICLYIIFQPWLIGDNLQNVQKSKVGMVKYLRFVPVLGLVAYLLCLDLEEKYEL